MLKRLMNPTHREARSTIVILLVLLAFGAVPASAIRFKPRTDTDLKKIARTLRKRGLNTEGTAKQTAGYYEGLLTAGAVVTDEVGGRSWFDWRFWFQTRPRREQFRLTTRRDLPDFVAFDLPPNANVAEYDEQHRLITNSQGLADQEYEQLPPPGAWRIALIGDSVTRGAGAEFGTSYEARLERGLNERYAGQPFSRYEILNFSVQAYQLTQFVDVALHRAPSFAPNVYAVALTDRSVSGMWSGHLSSLVRNHRDLKYDFLKKIVEEAGIAPNQSEGLMTAKLAPYRLPVLRWALDEMKAQADRAGAYFVVMLVPVPTDPEASINQFREVKAILAEKKIPTIDLMETFIDLDDLLPVRVSGGDFHPNEIGHKMLFESILKQVDGDPTMRAIFTGAGSAKAPRPQTVADSSEVLGQKSAQ